MCLFLRQFSLINSPQPLPSFERRVKRGPDASVYMNVLLLQDVVKLCDELLPSLAKSFKDPKVNLVIDDAFKFLENKENEYDVIICDSTDPGWGEGKCL